MEFLKRIDVETRKKGSFGRDPTTPGMYEKWLLNVETLEALMSIPEDEVAAVTVEELGSKGNTSNGCCYGINKVAVAGHLPIRAKSKGKGIVLLYNTRVFDESLYATDVTILDKRSDTAYEQPSVHQINRVHRWLEENGYVVPEMSELPKVTEVDEVSEMYEDEDEEN